MCRLFAFSFTDTTDEERKISLLNSFRELAEKGVVLNTTSPGHMDGWGTVIYSDNSEPHIYKSTAPAHTDSTFFPEKLFKSGVPQSGLAHLRKKTVGEASLSNTHPFVDGYFSFIHNGTVADNPYEEISKYCEGQTDSERLFKKFLELRTTTSSTKEAFLRMLKETKDSYPTYSAINTILHDGKYLYVSRIINPHNQTYSKDDLENYYTLYLGKTKNGDHFISSEILPEDDVSYTLIPNGSVCVLGDENELECVTL